VVVGSDDLCMYVGAKIVQWDCFFGGGKVFEEGTD